jgi:hypothetical protein
VIQHLRRINTSWNWLAASYLTLAVALQFFPLTGDLHYEFSAVVALAASLLTGIAVILSFDFRFSILDSRLKDSSDRTSGIEHPTSLPAPAPLAAANLLWRLSLRTILLSFIPLGVALVGSLFRFSCGILDGLAWYLLLVPASAWISLVIALLSGSLVRRRWVAILLFILFWSVSLFRGAHEAYWGPHIFMYAWQVGFFPGGSWDAELPISAQLVIYRAAHLLVAGALLLVAGELRRTRSGTARDLRSGVKGNPGILLFAGICALLAVACIPFRSSLGLTRTHSWLRAELGDSLHTRFATIYYNASRVDSLDLWRAANLTDFYITEHARTLELQEDRIEPITLYLYSSPSEEKRLVGTSSAAFTKPWLRTLNMPLASVGSTLRHELAHIMIAPFGNLLGISWDQGLLEGSAVALENDAGWRTLHEYARDLYYFRMAPPAEQVMSVGGFSSRRASLSYLLAGSFSKWLIDSYGIRKYLQAFPSGDFDGAYRKSLHQLSNEYRRFIDSLPPPDTTYRATMRYLFGGGSFFFQKCLRRIGTLNGEGFAALEERRYDRALERFRSSLDEGITYSARSGILRALLGMGDYRAVIDSSREYARDTASYPLLPMLVEQGDAHWAMGDTSAARRLYDSVLALDISQQLSTRAALRLYFMRVSDTLAGIMRNYFTRPANTQARLLLLDRAYRFARAEHEAEIIALMVASLTASQLPQTTSDWLTARTDEIASRIVMRYDDAINDPEREEFLHTMLGVTLDDLFLYRWWIDGAKGDAGGYAGFLGRYSPGSAAYRSERGSERLRFIEFLRHERWRRENRPNPNYP